MFFWRRFAAPHLCLRGISSETPSVTLRPYQEACLQACIDALDSGISRIGVSLPTGSGKTTVFVSLLARIHPPRSNPRAQRSLIIVNSIELAIQAATQTKALFPHWSVEIEQGAKHNASGSADVHALLDTTKSTVATYQTLLKTDRIEKFDARALKAIIVDEAHHAAAPSYRRLLSYFHARIQSPDLNFKPPELTHTIPLVGFSATFSRHDGLALGSVFERIVFHRDFLEMIKEQWLCDIRFTSVRADIKLDTVTVNSRTGDFNSTSLAQVINTETVNNLVVQTWLDRAATRKSTLIFCVNLAHVRQLTNSFRSLGIDARYIYSKTPAAERKALLVSFKTGAFPVLVNCAILTEGADIPNVDCVIIARPTRSRNLFAQMIGRGMRRSLATNKSDCRIIDFVASTSRVSGIVCTPTLFGLDPSEIDINDETIESLEKRVSEVIASDSQDNIPVPESVTYHDYENPFALVNESSGAPHIAVLSNHAWVGCGGDVYVLECLGKGHARIERVNGTEDGETHFQAWFAPAMIDKHTSRAFKISPFKRTRKILTALNLSDAVRGCDSYVKTKVVFGPMVRGLLRSASWRKASATEQQKSLIAKRWGKQSSIMDPDSRALTVEQKIEKLTKGEAANIITRLKHGAQARYKKKEKEEISASKAMAKERRRSARQVVQVGPLSNEDLPLT